MKLADLLLCCITLLASCTSKPEKIYISQMEELTREGFKNDKTFVIEEHAGAIRECAMADMIIKHTTDTELKALAQMVKDGHQAGIDQLEAIAAELKVTLVTEPFDVDVNKIELLRSMTSQELARYYLIHQQSMHGWDIAAFTSYANHAQNESLKKYVLGTIAPLKEHADQVVTLGRSKGIIP